MRRDGRDRNAYYREYRKKHHARVRESERKSYANHPRRQFVFEYKKAHPCVDCGESDPVVLDFDHVTGVKVMSIARLLGNKHTIESLLEEIAKCEMRCANCHRRKTVKQFGHYRYISSAAN